MSDSASIITSEHLKRCGVGTAEGVLTRSDKDVAVLMQTAVSMGILEIVAYGSEQRYSRFDGLYAVEIKTVAHAIGIAEKHLKKFAVATRTATLRRVLQRTKSADEALVKHMNAAEDIAPDRENISQFRPYSGLIVEDGDLDRIADRLSHVIGRETERLFVLDTYRAAQRIVRHVVRIAGGRTSIPVKFGHPSIQCMILASGRPVIGTTVVDKATKELEAALREDAHFAEPLERFWRIPELVLTSLGAQVRYDFSVFRKQ